MADFQAIVLGLGGVGSAAAYHLASRGVKTLGLDRFPAAHDRGSSHGETRIIRQAYLEHPDYVPLALSAYDAWGELERRTGRRLFHQAGLLQIGPPEGEVIQGVLRSAREHRLEITEHATDEIISRWPGLLLPPGTVGLYEERAGFLRVEDCVRAHLEEAARRGAELHADEPAVTWRAKDGGVVVHTAKSRYTADRIVITAGAWSGEVLRDLSLPLEVRRKPQYWFAAKDNSCRYDRGFPTFLFELREGIFYGFPQIDDLGVKVARHSGGAAVADPLNLDRRLEPDKEDQALVLRFAVSCLPKLTSRLLRHSVCMYTLTPDEHFIVDRHPEHSQVVFAAGLSGHGFKFSPILGQALAELTVDGATEFAIGFLALGREGIMKN